MYCQNFDLLKNPWYWVYLIAGGFGIGVICNMFGISQICVFIIAFIFGISATWSFPWLKDKFYNIRS